MARLFGTDGIRGVAGKELTRELAYGVGKALVHVLGNGNDTRVVIGMDTRESSEWLCEAIAEGICSVGAEAAVIGVCSTPAVAYLVKKHSFDAGVMISASHNPYQYNGIKIFGGDGFKLSDALEDKIEALIGQNTEECETGALTDMKYGVEEYLEYLIGSFGISLQGLKIGVDCANGSSSVTAERLFKTLGAECTIISAEPNGTNINRGCGSTHLENLKELVVSKGLDLGIAFDGDADRCLAIDKNGNEIDGDFIMAIVGLWLKEYGKLNENTIVGTIMSNLGFVKFCESNGINFFAAKVGDRYVLEKMNECGYSFGGEQSGHLILGDLATTGDGQLTAVALLSRIKESGKSLSTLAAIMKKYPQYMVNIKADIREKEIFKTDEIILSLIADAEKILKDTGRLVIRPSGTEPLIRIMAEGEELSQITDICNRLAEKITARLTVLKCTV